MTVGLKNTIDVRNLITDRKFPCVSVFIANDQPWPANNVARLELKNQLKEVRNQLGKMKVAKDIQDKCLTEIEDWIDADQWWKEVAGSLAFYGSGDGFARAYQVPVPLDTSHHVGHFFDVRPLITLVNAPEFYLATLTLDKTCLYHVTHSAFTNIDFTDEPTGFAEFSKYDDRETTLQNHAANGMGAIFHGQGGAKDFKKTRAEQFGHLMGKEISRHLKTVHTPLVVVGSLPLLGSVKQTLEVKHDNRNGVYFIEQDPNSRPLAQIVDEFRNFLKTEFTKFIEDTIDDRVAKYKSLKKTETRLDKVLKQAHRGRVRELFIGKQDYVWGQFEEDTEKVRLYKGHIAKSEDLLNMASIFTLRAGGEVYVLDPKKISIAEHAFAVLR